MKNVLGWVALGIAVLWVINNPAQAAAIIHHIAQAITTLTH